MCGVFVDLQKALDTVSHEVLLETLSHCGIRSKESNWFRSSLTKRKQYLSTKAFFSQTKIVRCDFPQGTYTFPKLDKRPPLLF